MRLISVLSLIFSAVSSVGFSQHLLINEVSQGVSGAEEYVEFVVPGSPTCAGVPTKDLRKMIIDDNNGLFESGSGSGIAPGAIRFANIAFWSAIPQGTIIVVYNESDRGAAIPPDDVSMSDGNGRLILPADSPLLEGQGASPSNGNNTYPTSDASWAAGAGEWAFLGMANSGDSFQVRMNASASAPYSAVSWGSNNSNLYIYFSGSASGKVFYCNGGITQAEWSSGDAATKQTPGAANNTANAAFIQSFITGGTTGLQVSIAKTDETCVNSCNGTLTSSVTGGVSPFTYVWSSGDGNVSSLADKCPGNYTLTVTDNNGCTGNAQASVLAATPMTVTPGHTNETCQNSCDGTAALQISGGTAPYSVSWSNGVNGTSITGLCPGSYTATIEDNNGCEVSSAVTITAGATLGSADFITTGPFLASGAPVQLQNQTNGGTYTTADCSGCLTAAGIFNPQLAGAGTFTICYTLTNQACSVTECADFVVGGCLPQTTSENIVICPGDSVFINGNWESTAATYAQVYNGSNGCDSTHNIILSFYTVNDINTVYQLCTGDSIQVFGQWTDTAGIFSVERQNSNGCTYFETITVIATECNPELALYIPNVFTPNGDNTNDVFRIELVGGLIVDGAIFNRWGNVVAEFSENVNSWDGKAPNGEISADGVYTYMVRYAESGGNVKIVHGHVTLIR